MGPLLTAIQIIIGLFALIGIYEFIRTIFDAHIIKKAGVKCKVLICINESDAEYAIRFAESRFVLGEYADLFDGIALSQNVKIDNEELKQLNKEFNYNISVI